MKGKWDMNVILKVVLVFLAVVSAPAVKAADVDYSSYAYELRHKKAAVDADVAAVAKEKTDVIVEESVILASADWSASAEKSPQEDLTVEEENVILKKDCGAPNSCGTVKPKEKPALLKSDEWMVKPGDEKRKSPVEQLSRNLSIDKVFNEARSIPSPASIGVRNESPAFRGFDSQTDAQIITGLVKPELRRAKVDLDFHDASLSDVFMTLGKSGGINVMLDPMIKDLMIDINLKQVTLKEAFILMAVSYNLGFKRIESSLFVTTKDKLLQQSVAYKVIKLRNVKALDVKAMVADLIRTVNVSEQTNSLIVIGQPEEIAKVEGVVRTVDRAQPQVILEANIVEINKDALKDLGIDWSDQVSLTFQEGGRPVTMPNVASPADSVLEIGAFERSPLSFTAIIKMLENENKAKVLSNPRVTTMNEREAEIFVGDRIPYTINTVDGGVNSTEVRFEEPGIRLKITPMIIDGDFVVVKVEPEVSFIFAFRGPDNQFPWVKKRHATAYVRIRNNEPFVLGGLLTQEEKKNLFKVPLLGNIPWLGNLFSYEKHTVTDTELIITITPTVVQGQ